LKLRQRRTNRWTGATGSEFRRKRDPAKLIGNAVAVISAVILLVLMVIRLEEQKDWTAVHSVNVAAFRTSAEAHLVDVLREQARPYVSLVAEDNGIVIGHIMFSPVSLTGHSALSIMGLGPMAVSPAHQRRGVGSALVRAGLARSQELGFGAVVVLGCPGFYPRFGFSTSDHFDIGCEYEVPADTFMVVELQTGFLRGATGTIKYHSAFGDV